MEICVICERKLIYLILYQRIAYNFHIFTYISFYTFRFFMVFTCLALSVFSTIEGYEDEAIKILLRMEILVVIWFTIEFALR